MRRRFVVVHTVEKADICSSGRSSSMSRLRLAGRAAVPARDVAVVRFLAGGGAAVAAMRILRCC